VATSAASFLPHRLRVARPCIDTKAMAENFKVTPIQPEEGVPMSENAKRKVERTALLYKQKSEAILQLRKKRRAIRQELRTRTLMFNEEYETKAQELVQHKRHAKDTGGFYKEEDPKIIFVIRIKGINKLAPKPKKILQLFRLRQLHNGVFLKLNKATNEMLKCIQPFVTYGYPSLSVIRQLIYKRGYVKVGKPGARQRVRIQHNEIISDNLGQFGVHGVEDIVHEIFTCGPNFKAVNNFLWPFKLNSPRKGFVAKRHGFSEPRKGDWGGRDALVNELIKRML